jgi:hypothetical protein
VTARISNEEYPAVKEERSVGAVSADFSFLIKMALKCDLIWEL